MRAASRVPTGSATAREPSRLASEIDDPRSLLTAIGAVPYDWNIAGDTLAWGMNVGDVFGLRDTRGIATGKAYSRLVHPRSPSSREVLLQALSTGAVGRGVPYRLRYYITLPGGLAEVEDIGRWFAGPGGLPARARGLVHIILADEAVAAQTQGRGGNGAREELLDGMRRAGADGRQRALLVLSVGLSDASGAVFEPGDEAMRLMLAQVKSVLHGQDILSRYEFNRAGLLIEGQDEEEIAKSARDLASLVAATPLIMGQRQMRLTLACGGALIPRPAGDPGEVLRRCEAACEEAARARAHFVLAKGAGAEASPKTSKRAAADEMVDALGEGRVLLARQPVIASGTGRVVFNEAFLRMRRTDGHIVSAGAAVPLFEALGWIDMIDRRVLELAFEDLAREPELCLSVNVSAATLRGSAWHELLSGALTKHPSLAGRLIVELPEAQAVQDLAATVRAFDDLRARGVRTAIDDFGAGHITLQHLRELKVDILKIDGAFVQSIGPSSNGNVFVRALIKFARDLGIETAAEWVRDEESARLLTGWGVTYLQGDHIGVAQLPAERA